jgi:hypothetical protein
MTYEQALEQLGLSPDIRLRQMFDLGRLSAPARGAPDVLRFSQWTAGERDLSDYILVGHLALAGIEDGEYGQSEIHSLENTIEALQEHLVTGSEHKKVPLLAYIRGLNTAPATQPSTNKSLVDEPAPVHSDSYRIDWLTNNPLDALDIFGHTKGADAVRWIRQEIDNAIKASKGQP